MIAFIPARGGSKGIPGKNIAVIDGKPMIAYSIEAALQSPYIERVVVSSDCVQILEIAKKFGAEALLRPIDIALDKSPTSEAIEHFIEAYKLLNSKNEHILLLQATSPLRNVNHINEAIKQFENGNAKTLISISEFETSPYRAYTMDDNFILKSVFTDDQLSKRRQDYDPTFAANGALYIFSCKDFLKEKGIPLSSVEGYLMHSPYDLDIDTKLDLEFLKFLIEKKYLNS